jgi:hypothetical protein
MSKFILRYDLAKEKFQVLVEKPRKLISEHDSSDEAKAALQALERTYWKKDVSAK